MIGVGKSALRDKLLTYYIANKSAKRYVRELAGMLQLDPKNLSAELTRLESQGLFVSEMRGNQRHYRLSRSAYAKQLLRIIEHFLGIPEIASHELARAHGIEKVFIYGSFAKGSSDAHSDLDLLVVGNPPAVELAAAARKLEQKVQREVNYTAISPAELERRLKNNDPFIADIWKGKRIELKLTTRC